jgi:hypothetical protein
MNGTGVDWDGYAKLSSTGLGNLGWDKVTALTAGESYSANNIVVNWNDVDTLGIRSTSTSTVGGSIKGVDSSALVQELPRVSIGDAEAVVEGGTAQFTVTLSNTYPYDVKIFYQTQDGTASDGSDYTAANSYVIIPAGQTSATITVDTLNNNAYELAENFTVKLTEAKADIPDSLGGDIALSFTDDFGQGTINDDDPKPSFSIDDVTKNEGDGTITFTVTKTGATEVASSVDFQVNPGTAGTPGDYTGLLLSGTLNFAANQTQQTITLAIADDDVYELTEQFTVSLSNAVEATISDSQGSGTIVDNDPAPTVTIGDSTASEGEGLVFAVGLSNPSYEAITLRLAAGSSPGTATAGSDYEMASFEYSTDGGTSWTPATGAGTNEVTIPAGSNGILVRVDTVEDAIFESDETMTLSVASVVSGTVTAASDTGTGTISNDDAPPSFAIDDVTKNEGDGTITFTVTKIGATAVNSTVDYTAVADTATAPADYTTSDPLAGTFTFLPGETSKTITLNITDDTSFEQTEQLFVNLSGASNATISDNQGVGTITDNDPAGPVFGPTLTADALPSSTNGESTGDPTDNNNDGLAGGTNTNFSSGTNNLTNNDDVVTDASSGGNRTINGLDGADTIYAGANGDTLNGGSGDDYLYGQAGADTLNGGDGDDHIFGGSGNDSINGGIGNDTIYAGTGQETGSNTIFGGSGDDTVYAGSGQDTIVGEAGADHIYGGYGSDTINLGLNDDSSIDTAHYLSLQDTNDTIGGFVSGQDKIDLSTLDAILGGDDDAFVWSDQTPTNTAQVAANSVSWYTSGGNVTVIADTDGNTATAEFQITLTGVTTISQNDFIL